MSLALSATATLALAALLGVAAGTLTTVSGFGGGMLLAVALAPVLGPAGALVVVSPALALGHVHRAYLYRDQIDRRIAGRFLIGAVPGTILGGLLAASVPEQVLAVALLFGLTLAVAQALGKIPAQLGRRALIPGGASVGFLAASCGGGGVMLPPTLMSAGLSGRSFVATAATGAAVVQVVRLSTYAAAGMVGSGQLPVMAVVAVGLIGGNILGRRLALRVDDRHTAWLTRSTLGVAVALGLFNLVI
ncbi:MAG: sulfite exporter TauE/SafE family protein [Myxococcales bacterium]|nr:sulfite exporter TauE/SafE family protein [Myxococcales bacterium]